MSENKWGNICNRVDTCALAGAAAFFGGIPHSEILVNGPAWCYFYALRHLENTVYDMADRFHVTQSDNSAIIFGGEKFLAEALQKIKAAGRKIDVLLVENSCSMSLIGDDNAGIARMQKMPFPVVTMDCSGLDGGFAEGYSKACIALLKETAYPESETIPASINILGLSDFYFNGKQDIKEICRILNKAGYIINAVPGGGSTLARLRNVGAAELNVVCCEELGLKTAEYLKEKYGTPYICAGIPYGIEGTQKWLKKIHSLLPCSDLELIEQEGRENQKFLTVWNNAARSVWGDLWFDNVLVSAPGTTALCIAEALRREWMDTANLTVICQQEVAKEYCTTADLVLTAGKDSEAIDSYLKDIDNVLLLGSSSESSLFYRMHCRNFISCNIAYPVNDEVLLTELPFAGIRGSAHMLQRLWNMMISNILSRQVTR